VAAEPVKVEPASGWGHNREFRISGLEIGLFVEFFPDYSHFPAELAVLGTANSVIHNSEFENSNSEKAVDRDAPRHDDPRLQRSAEEAGFVGSSLRRQGG